MSDIKAGEVVAGVGILAGLATVFYIFLKQRETALAWRNEWENLAEDTQGALEAITTRVEGIKVASEEVSDKAKAIKNITYNITEGLKTLKDENVIIPKVAMGTIYKEYIEPTQVKRITDPVKISNIIDKYRSLRESGFSGFIGGGSGSVRR